MIIRPNRDIPNWANDYSPLRKTMQDDSLKISEEILFRRYCDGDTAAFNTLLKRLKGLVYSLILRFTHDTALADEIFQEVFLKICKNKDQFREAISFKSWLMTVCRNTCIDFTRKQGRSLKTVPLDGNGSDDDRPLADKLATTDPTPLDELSFKVEDQALNSLLDNLPIEQRETFYMKIIGDLTFEEIGSAMQCSTNTAKSRFRYALATLRGLVRRQQILVGANHHLPNMGANDYSPLHKKGNRS